MKWLMGLAVIVMTGLMVSPRYCGAEVALEKGVIDMVGQATYEVVVPKPTKDSLSYEKPLPIDLLPYAERKDKYYSIGTAFAIAPDRFVSANHVLNLGNKSQYPDYFLRDREGKVYLIDQIVKYSDRRDFVVFTLKDRKESPFLATNTRPALNETVYAVGNALGEGVVIRDGLYTSDTLEEEEGEWKWLRFSAAASPGNSGGPLLDRQGRVIGIVLRKSSNENLNVALPIAEVLNAPENRASIHKKMKYMLDNMDMTKIETLKESLSLPKSYQELNRELVETVNRFADKLLAGLLAENRENIFPNGKGSTILLNRNFTAFFPNMIAKGEDGNWDLYSPKEERRSELGNNGHLVYGTMGNSLYLILKKPDNIPLDKLYTDSKTFMDLVLKGVTLSRPFGGENIKVTSLGKADTEYMHGDSYGRKWLVWSWPLEYSDEKIVAFFLPVPGGGVAMLRRGQTGRLEDGHVPDLKVLADFLQISYYGSLKQWKEFLAARAFLPELFSRIDIAFEYNNNFRYKSEDRVAFSYNADLMHITEKSDLKLNIGYFKDGGKTVWDVTDIVPGDDKSNSTCFVLDRNQRPPDDMSDNFRSDWENLVNRRMPYDKVSFFKDKTTAIMTVFTKGVSATELDRAPVLYNVGFVKTGSIEQKEMAPILDKFMENLAIYEGTPRVESKLQ